jgi:hypothetical protein
MTFYEMNPCPVGVVLETTPRRMIRVGETLDSMRSCVGDPLFEENGASQLTMNMMLTVKSRFSQLIPSVNKHFSPPRLSSLLAALLLLTGCAGQLPANAPKVLVFPAVDERVDKSRPIQRFFSETDQILLERKYRMAFEIGDTEVPPASVAALTAVNSAVLKSLPNKGEQYALILTVARDGYDVGGLLFRYDVTGYLIRIADGTILWTDRIHGSLWQGLLMGPLNNGLGVTPSIDQSLLKLLDRIPKNLLQ